MPETDTAFGLIATLWLGGSALFGLIATFAFRRWLSNEMREGRIERGSFLFLMSNIAEWKYLGRLRVPTEDPKAEEYRKRALLLYAIFTAWFVGGFVAVVVTMLAASP